MLQRMNWEQLPMGCLIGVPIAACMVIPMIIAFIGVEQKRRAMVWALLFLGLIMLDQALEYLPIQTGINSAHHLYGGSDLFPV